ncbi:hypothetical protein RUM43_010132 [Polyplax serrata]|uniref:Uncharacterized protein n=1 Tax=Polyplax serrata TaxID=468196 RepID=A0AAN8PK68_POLSC
MDVNETVKIHSSWVIIFISDNKSWQKINTPSDKEDHKLQEMDEEVTPQRKSETKRTRGELQDSVAISQSLIESFTRHKTRNFILEVSKPADRPDIMHTTGETQGTTEVE